MPSRDASEMQVPRSYSQIGQDIWVIEKALPGQREGFFVDVGAYDGVTFSNTCLLEKEYGWKGLCVEASPSSFDRLKTNRSCITVQSLVDSEKGSVDFIEGAAMLSRPMDRPRKGLKNLWEYWLEKRKHAKRVSGSSKHGRIIPMKAVLLADILKNYRVPHVVDYLSMDIEGREEAILSSFPFNEYRFRCMTVEYKNNNLQERETFFRKLRSLGYVLTGTFFTDCFFMHEAEPSAAQISSSWFEEELARRIDPAFWTKPELAHVEWIKEKLR